MTTRPRARLALAALALGAACLLLAGCAATLPSDPPSVIGTVTSVVGGDGRPASFSVEGTQAPGTISDKALVNIPPTTLFFGADGKAASLDSINAIGKGTSVRVWFQGAVAESYPVQGSAKAVQLLGK